MKVLKRFWWIFLLGILAGGGFLIWRNAKAQEIKTNSYLVKKQDLVESLSLSGEVDALEKAELKFQTSGLLTWVGVKEGDYVKKYQAIASLDRRELQNSMNQYLNSYMKERWEFEQGVDDNKNWQTVGMTDAARDTVKRTLDKNQFDLNNSVLAFEARNLALKFATLTTPFEGIITKIDVPQPGSNVTPSTAVFSLVNPKTLYFSATADQTEVVNFEVGKTGKVVLESFPEQELLATIERVSFSPKEGESGTVYEIEMSMEMENMKDKLKLGMTGDSNFTLRELKNVLAIPEAYISEKSGKKYVTKIMGDRREATEVTIGENIDGQVEIKSGINEGDTLYNQP
ncbi:MAG: efflux transporter, RND family, MFP subunit [Microgenomates group bacterium GW2011_GWC1_44_9]|nr:MAG: efflux transporter, RND family, MFP subunit [Microgenomates group bacterium GW2011_GWC1_44_9]